MTLVLLLLLHEQLIQDMHKYEFVHGMNRDLCLIAEIDVADCVSTSTLAHKKK